MPVFNLGSPLELEYVYEISRSGYIWKLCSIRTIQTWIIHSNLIINVNVIWKFRFQIETGIEI